MSLLRISSGTEQVAEFLKRGLVERRWSGTMPGRDKLANELGVNRKTIDSALRQLEKEGILLSQGPRRRRTISIPDDLIEKSSLRIAILLSESGETQTDFIVQLQHRLESAGHSASFAAQTLDDLKSDIGRVKKLVESTNADAWVVVAGSREVLTWFHKSGIPTFAMFGRRHEIAIAGIGPDKTAATITATRRLIELGHRRIVMIVRRARRLPEPGKPERAFLAELEAHGIRTGPYNLPDWEETPDGLHRCIKSIFRLTPPTAMIIDEPPIYQATQHHLARMGILAPEHISLVCTDADQRFEWQQPSVAHIRWDSGPWLRRAVRWASNVSRSRIDTMQSVTKAEFIEGGTIGPCPKS